MTERSDKIKEGLKALDQDAAEMVVIESPYAGHTDLNVNYLEEAILDCFNRGEIPFASHGFYTSFLDDDDLQERELGIRGGFLIGSQASKVVVYEDLGVSKGMRKGINRAKERGTEIEFRTVQDWNSPRQMVRAFPPPVFEDYGVRWDYIHPIVPETIEFCRERTREEMEDLDTTDQDYSGFVIERGDWEVQLDYESLLPVMFHFNHDLLEIDLARGPEDVHIYQFEGRNLEEHPFSEFRPPTQEERKLLVAYNIGQPYYSVGPARMGPNSFQNMLNSLGKHP